MRFFYTPILPVPQSKAERLGPEGASLAVARLSPTRCISSTEQVERVRETHSPFAPLWITAVASQEKFGPAVQTQQLLGAGESLVTPEQNHFPAKHQGEVSFPRGEYFSRQSRLQGRDGERKRFQQH